MGKPNRKNFIIKSIYFKDIDDFENRVFIVSVSISKREKDVSLAAYEQVNFLSCQK